MNKFCIICNKTIKKGKREGQKRWLKRKFCSSLCYRKHQLLNPNKGTFPKGNHPISEFKKGHPKPKNAYVFPNGKSHPNWKGEKAKYSAFHMRVREKRGLANKCDVCGLNSPKHRYEWANLTGNYADIFDYKMMCCSCHTIFDNKKRTSHLS